MASGEHKFPWGAVFLQRCQKKGVEMRGSANDVKGKGFGRRKRSGRRLEDDLDFHNLGFLSRNPKTRLF